MTAQTASSTTTSSDSKPFPVKAKVVLQGLKAADFNDQVGIVQGPVNSEGRQSVYVEALDKTVALKLTNLQYQERPIDSLSNKELKKILISREAVLKFQGMDKSDLREKLEELTTDPLQIADWLAHANAGGGNATTDSSSANSSATTSNANAGTSSMMNQLDSMSPEMLRQQAQAMRSMPPATIRAMNPQLAHMSDAQIQQAAAQMEMMASNPAMMQQAKQQMKNLTPAQQAEYQRMMGTNGVGAGAGAGAATAPTQSPQEKLANMSPEQLRQQAQMMRSMPPDTVRAMNPQLAGMTDAQIQQAANQMEMMAGNPSLMKMASEQMKNLTPQQMEEMMKGGPTADSNSFNPMAMGMGPQSTNNGSNGQPNMAMDPTKMLETMEPKQIKEMFAMLKSNPEMLEQMAAQSGMPKEGLQKTLAMFSDMPDDQLESSLKTMAKLQKTTAAVQSMWKKADSIVGGHLRKILVGGGILMVIFLVLYLLGGESPEAAATATKIVKDSFEPPMAPTEEAVPTIEDEFSEL